MKLINTLNLLLLSLVILISSCSKNNPDPEPSLDCNGIENGTSMLDDCGDCQKAYKYNMTTHAVTLLDDTTNVTLEAGEMLIMPDNSMNPYWNAGCIIAPENYEFIHNGISTVAYPGQTTRLQMAKQLTDALKNGTHDLNQLQDMWANGTGFSGGIDNVDKTLQSKFSASPTASATVTLQLDNMLNNYAVEVLPNWNNNASIGNSGEYTTASQNRTVHINEKGMEIDQCFAKALIGGLCFDQSVNKYLSVSAVSSDNENRDPSVNSGSTEMEHKWDEGFGYVYGMIENNTTGDLSSDALLGKYLNKSGFEDQKSAVWDAFKLGRAAIIGKDYTVRDAQTVIIKSELSKVIAAKAIGYLTASADLLESEGGVSADYFHEISEGWGFILSLQYTDWFSNSDVNAMLTELENGHGFWDRTAAELDAMAASISNISGVAK